MKRLVYSAHAPYKTEKKYLSNLQNIPLQLPKNSMRNMVTGYRVQGRDSILSRGRSFALLYNVHLGSGTHQASYTIDTEQISLEVIAGA
jgi:hypothetical protein